VSDPMTHIAHTSRSTDSKDFYSTTGFWSTHKLFWSTDSKDWQWDLWAI